MDMNLLAADLQSLPEADKTKISSIVDHLQVRDSLRLYNALAEKCFSECVHSFYRKTLGKQEENCVNRCAEKFLKHSVKVGMKFAELNQGPSTQ